MNYKQDLVEAVLLRRYKRFLADVELADGTVVTAWCPNPGSMKSLLADRARCRVSYIDDPKRKLKWTLEQIHLVDSWAMVYASRANDVVGTALKGPGIAELSGYPVCKAEQKYGKNSRIDFLLLDGDRRAYVEVKNVTLAQGSVGLFPDSVSKRGTKHLHDLMEVVTQGHRGVMLYHLGRSDVNEVRPADAIDPEYGRALRQAVAGGVEAYAYRCIVDAQRLVLGDRVPVVL